MSNKKYEVKIGKKALKSLKKMDKGESAMIMAWVKDNLMYCEDPYRFGKPLRYNLKGTWRYRVGDYRIITNINENEVVILLLEVKHRKEVYDEFK